MKNSWTFDELAQQRHFCTATSMPQECTKEEAETAAVKMLNRLCKEAELRPELSGLEIQATRHTARYEADRLAWSVSASVTFGPARAMEEGDKKAAG